LRALVAYLQTSGRWGNLQADDPLWTRHDRAGQPGKALTGHALAANLKRYAAKVGIADFHLHTLRHTVARIVGDETGSIGATQEILGHRNQSNIRVYLQAVGVKRDKHSNGILDRVRA
jgi:integrase